MEDFNSEIIAGDSFYSIFAHPESLKGGGNFNNGKKKERRKKSYTSRFSNEKETMLGEEKRTGIKERDSIQTVVPKEGSFLRQPLRMPRSKKAIFIGRLEGSEIR